MPTYEEALRLPEALNESRLLLFDGHAHAYRAFYAIRDLSSRDGTPVNALFGVWRGILAALRQHPSAYVAFVFDAEGKTFRHELWEGYKATRPSMPSELALQLPLIRDLLDALGIAVLSRGGVEADDVLASLAVQGARCGLSCLVSTFDKDMAQVVGERISLVRPASRASDGNQVLDADGVLSRYGVRPDQIVDFLSLVGDASDNVPGVPTIGEKTALRLLAEFGSLDALLARTEEVANPRVREALRAHGELARKAQRLVRLQSDLDVGEVRETCRLRGIDLTALQSFLVRVGFESALRELSLPGLPASPDSGRRRSGDVHVILDEAALRDMVARLRASPRVSVRLETTSPDPLTAAIVGFAACPTPDVGFYVPMGHDALDAPAQLDPVVVFESLRPVLEGSEPQILGAGLKSDLSLLSTHGIELDTSAFDVVVAAYLLRPEDRRHDLGAAARAFLGDEIVPVAADGAGDSPASLPVVEAARRATEAAGLVQRLYPPLARQLEDAGLTRLFSAVEMPLVGVLARMERNGVLVDPGVLADQGAELHRDLARIEADLFDIAGGPFNPNSPKQVAEILFERLHLPVLERTKTGPSTSADVLAQLSIAHALPGKLLAYRELSKLLSTYIEQLREAIHPRTGRIHSHFHQTGTVTGRLSSSDPNLQNIPTRSDVGGRIRRAFVAPDGFVLLGADYSQVELRLLAHLSGDGELIAALCGGADLHRLTAGRVFGVPPEAVSAAQRDAAKRINFGILYGITPFGLAKELAVSSQEAAGYIERFFRAYPDVQAFVDERIRQATERGFAETILGRRRALAHLGSRVPAQRNVDRRNAVNMPIQGSAADLIKMAMIEVDRRIRTRGWTARMILQIHDELVFEVRREEQEAFAGDVRQAMENVMSLRVPLEVKLASGANWGEI